MKKYALLLLVCITTLNVNAQYTLKLLVTQVATRGGEDIYVAGNFNSWNPKDPNYKLKPFGNNRIGLVLKNLEPGRYEFKFTRGSWEKGETSAEGNDIANRAIELNTDFSMECNIAGWRDDYPVKPKPYTALPQVKLLDSAFKIPQLNRTRSIWIYLPKGYNANAGKTYPVLYMHDGQNLFNEQTAAFGEWGVDECLDTLQPQTGKYCIVVGIASDPSTRMSEYSPYTLRLDPKKADSIAGEGKAYVDFIVQTLKPYIDKNYRTSREASRTFIAGSSMGGVISLYALLQYPTVFGTAGIFSPAFWTVPKLYSEATNFKPQANQTHRLYFYAGAKESNSMVGDMDKMVDLLEQKQANRQITSLVNPLGKHNETTWRAEFADFYKWLVNW
jgi:predicted alpha/beta superfamily hydrolase